MLGTVTMCFGSNVSHTHAADVDNLQRISKSELKKAVKASCSLVFFAVSCKDA